MSGVNSEDARRTLESMGLEALELARRQLDVGFAIVIVDREGGLRVCSNLDEEQRRFAFARLLTREPDERDFKVVPKTGMG